MRARGGLTIGQAAAYAGVTIKTVRHYHRLGLVAEPERDTSGYRRYGSAELLRLVQARTLAGAGVPLAEVGELLDAEPERFSTAVDDVHRRLTDQIEDLVARRDTLHRIAHGDRALLPDRACAVLDRMAELGFSADYLATQREALVLTRALVPEMLDPFVTRLEHVLDDPEHVELTKRAWEAGSWPPDDPRLDGLAAALAEKVLADSELLAAGTGLRGRSDNAARYALVNRHREDVAPSIARLNELVEARLLEAGVDFPRG
ncbi:MerR family transcriptional regulator [Streptomyces sp. NPDC051684]|uniref:MerR family transcriptional regulator n=1 Tax=Streptomyces sp. NPDC051684 TaxID=3365670 RepID=UPI0037A3F57F